MTEESGTEAVCRESGKTGEKSTCQRQAPPFYGITSEFLADKYANLYNYGVDPSDSARITHIIYHPPDGPRASVAGYISVINTDLSVFFSQSEYRIGVELNLVKKSLDARIKAAEKLIEKDGGDEVDNSDMGARALENIEEKVDILKDAFQKLDDIINQSWTHAILVSAWKDGKVDRLDLNADFFDVFYPETAFPIAGIYKGGERWVNRNYFLWDYFPKGTAIPSRRKGRKLWNRFDYEMETEKFPNLRITFNFARIDVINQMTDQKVKLVVKKKWPTIDEIVEALEVELEENFYGKGGDKARRRAWKQIARCQRRAMKHAKKKSRKARKLVEKSNECAEKLLEGIRNSLGKEHDQLMEELDNVDPMSPELDRKAKDSVDNLADQQYAGDTGDALTDEAFDKIHKKYRERGKKQLEDLENQDPNAKGFDKKVKDLLDTEEKLQGSGDEGLKPFEKINEKLTDSMSDMAHGKAKWDGKKFVKNFSNNQKTGGTLSLSDEEWEKAKQQNYDWLEKKYAQKPIMDKDLKYGIKLHITFFHEDIPPSLMQNANIRSFVKRLKEQMKRVAEKSQEQIKADMPLELPDRKDPGRVQ